MNATRPLRKVERQLEILAAEIARLRKQSAEAGPAAKSHRIQADHGRDAVLAYLALTPAVDEDALLQMLLRCAMGVVGAGGAGLTLLDAKRNRLIFRAAVGDGAQGIIGQEVPLKGSRHGLAFATGEVQSATPLFGKVEKKAQTHFRNVLVAPMHVAGEGVGTISAVNKQGADHFSPEDMAAYKLFADLAAVVVRQRSREQILRRGLTGARKSAARLPVAFAPEDAELLALFESMTRLRNGHPEWVPLMRQLIEGIVRSSS
jgi:GAF domain-containing protein